MDQEREEKWGVSDDAGEALRETVSCGQRGECVRRTLVASALLVASAAVATLLVATALVASTAGGTAVACET